MEVNRDYISYSQYKLFRSSPKAYFEKYCLDKETGASKAQNFGKEFMKELEFENKDTEDKTRDFFLDLIKGKDVESEIKIQSPYVNRDLFGIIDICEKDFKHFYEIKTGKTAWTQDKVDRDEQILFYALLIKERYNIVPKATFIWAESKEDENGDIKTTGEIKTFEREFTLNEILKFRKKVAKTVDDISNYEHAVEDVSDKDEKLLELITEKKRIEEELELLKAEIMLELKEHEGKYAESQNFNITLASRKTYTYSDTFKEIETRHKAKMKKMKLEEEKSGVAKARVTEYLLIKAKK